VATDTGLWPYRKQVFAEAGQGVWRFLKVHIIWELVLAGGVGIANYVVRDDPHGLERAVESVISTVIVLCVLLVFVALWQLVDGAARLLSGQTPVESGERILRMKGAHNARIQPGALSEFGRVEIEDCQDFRMTGGDPNQRAPEDAS
jgi:hypothetical protein